jgi:hypothetical protein
LNKKLLQFVVLAGGLALGGAANAVTVTFDSVNDTYLAQYVYTIDGASINASVRYTLTSFNTSTEKATFSIQVANNSSGPGQNALMSFGIDIVAPTLGSVADNSGVWDSSVASVLPGFQTVDFCAYAANGCTGGAIGQGLAEGGSSSFLVTMTFSGNLTTSGITFTSPFPVKFQGVGVAGKSYELDICSTGTCSPPQQVPEPGSLALLGIVALSFGALRRYRKA